MKSMLLMLAVLAVLRVSFLLATLDPAEERVMEVLDPSELEWDAGPERPLYDREELFTATAAEAIRGRFGLPLTSAIRSTKALPRAKQPVCVIDLDRS